MPVLLHPPASAAPGTFHGFAAAEGQAQCLGMMNFPDLVFLQSDRPAMFTDQLRLAVAAYLARSRAPPAGTPRPTCAVTSPGAPGADWTRWPRGARTWSCTSGGCKKSARFKRLRAPTSKVLTLLAIPSFDLRTGLASLELIFIAAVHENINSRG